MSPVLSVPEPIVANTTPSTSTTQPRKIPSNRMPLSTSALNPFTSIPSTSTVTSTSTLSSRNRSRKQKNLNKDLGRWKPTDDLMLIQSVLQVRFILLMNRQVENMII